MSAEYCKMVFCVFTNVISTANRLCEVIKYLITFKSNEDESYCGSFQRKT